MPDLKYTKDLYGPLKVKNLQVQKIRRNPPLPKTKKSVCFKVQQIKLKKIIILRDWKRDFN